MADAFIDADGIHIPSYPDILAALKEEFRAIYGPDIYLEEDSQDGQMIAVFAQRYYDLCTLAASVYNSYSPATAQGAGLSSVVKTNGIRRHVASRSNVDLRIIGQAGTLINNGVAADGRGNNWLMPVQVIIPISGEITVTALAENAGDIRADAGEITVIAGGSTRGWQQVHNPLGADPGAPVETDYQLRKRQSISTALPSLTAFEGTKGGVANIVGVTRWQGYENDTSETDENGIPPHTICMVVEGGDSQTIADIIALKKTPGCGTYGNTALQVFDKYGIPNKIKFQRPQDIEMAVEIDIRVLQGYYTITGTDIKQNLITYINELEIGDDILLSKLYTPINAAEPVAGVRTFDVVDLRIGVKAGVLASVNMDIPYDGAVFLAEEDIIITVTGG